ncbi:AAA family ATPase [Leifsonia sp. Root112D2]|uniref:AAA family ATPase n=1 Tax=Leifsonia sp. Root112D2 TaxID=1736426 RepID=UPI000A914FD4|nr:regulator [Leifsonia sp. Root112D2]
MVTLALALDHRVEDRLGAEMVAGGHEIIARLRSAAEIIALLQEHLPDVVLVGASRKHLSEGLIAACDARAVRLIALASSDLERRHAASLGLYEVVDAAAPWGEIETVLTGGPAVPSRLGPRTTGRAATVIAVWGPAGAPGRTSLAITIAAEIAARGHRVALADVDTYGGCVAPALGMLDEAPGFAAACRLAGTDSLNQSELERIAGRYSSPQGAFWVLSGIGRPTRWPELTADRVTTTIEACRHWVDYLVMDTGFSIESDEEISSDLFAPRRNAATIAALGAADRIVAVGLADPVGISRFLRAHVDLVEQFPQARVSVVMNRVRAAAVGLNPFGQVSSTLARFAGIESPVLVPHDAQAFDAAVLAGKTLRDTAPRSPARAAVRRLVDSTLLPAGDPAPRAGRRAARFSRRQPRRLPSQSPAESPAESAGHG